ncbi:hypothetical protein GW17_00059876 [Ensete ventricosum]|nr:hypothetical protein GW17_00059876 [Ensete ventricosum]RZR76059.1 hypothetical protein BHM03_00000664 [Ensete ventricosum]
MANLLGWQKAEAEVLSLKQQLDDALLQKRTAEERVVNRDMALKQCMQQLHAVKEEQQFIITNAALKISREQEKTRTTEQKLIETNKRIADLVMENGNLNRILDVKEQLLKELTESKSKSEANFADVKSRVGSSEKLNDSLKYELCMLQKELEIRNEEREFNHRSSNAAHRQHLESVKKIAKLETECQRLRVMVSKRLPGPTALAKMKSEVEMLGNMKESIRKQFDAEESCGDNELKAVIYSAKKVGKRDAYEEYNITEERKRPLSASNGLNNLSRTDDIESKVKDENEHLKYEIMSMEHRRKELEEKLKTISDKNETLIAQLRKSEKNSANLQIELAALRESKGQIEDQIINQKLINEDLGTQLTVAKAELNEARQKFSTLEVELEEKSNCCEELEATCLELQLQLER